MKTRLVALLSLVVITMSLYGDKHVYNISVEDYYSKSGYE